MTIECKMAVTSVKLTNDGSDVVKGVDVYSKPMRLTKSMTSTLVVQFSQDGGVPPEEEWALAGLVKAVPRAMWDRCKSPLTQSLCWCITQLLDCLEDFSLHAIIQGTHLIMPANSNSPDDPSQDPSSAKTTSANCSTAQGAQFRS